MGKFIKNQKIGKKLLFSFSTILAFFAVTIICAIGCIIIINNQMSDFYSKPYVNNVLQMEIRKDVQYVGKQLLWSLTTDSLEETKERLAISQEYAKIVSDNIDALKANFPNKELMDKLTNAFSTLASTRAQVSEFSTNQQNEEALALFNGEYDAAVTKLQDVLAEIGSYADEVADNAYNAANRIGVVAMIVMIVLGLLSAGIGIYLAISITKAIKQPVTELEYAAEKLSKGELDIDITYESEDELGALAANFKKACTFMQELIRDISYLLGEVAKGNLSIDTEKEEEYIGEFKQVLAAIAPLLLI